MYLTLIFKQDKGIYKPGITTKLIPLNQLSIDYFISSDSYFGQLSIFNSENHVLSIKVKNSEEFEALKQIYDFIESKLTDKDLQSLILDFSENPTYFNKEGVANND